MFNPPNWTHDNIKFPDKDIDEIISKYKKIIPKVNGNFSSFWQRKNPEIKWLSRYQEIIKDMLDNMGVYNYSNYTFTYWGQLYLNDCFHNVHHHFHQDVDLSFVHFIRVDEPLFKFTNRKGDYYIPKQDEGDLLCFPSWLWHEVKSCNSKKERFVIAGNINITKMNCPN